MPPRRCSHAATDILCRISGLSLREISQRLGLSAWGIIQRVAHRSRIPLSLLFGMLDRGLIRTEDIGRAVNEASASGIELELHIVLRQPSAYTDSSGRITIADTGVSIMLDPAGIEVHRGHVEKIAIRTRHEQ